MPAATSRPAEPEQETVRVSHHEFQLSSSAGMHLMEYRQHAASVPGRVHKCRSPYTAVQLPKDSPARHTAKVMVYLPRAGISQSQWVLISVQAAMGTPRWSEVQRRAMILSEGPCRVLRITWAGEEQGDKGLVSVGADAVSVWLPLRAGSLGVVVDHEHTVVVRVARVRGLRTPTSRLQRPHFRHHSVFLHVQGSTHNGPAPLC